MRTKKRTSTPSKPERSLRERHVALLPHHLVEPATTKRGTPCRTCQRSIAQYGHRCPAHMEDYHQWEAHQRITAQQKECYREKRKSYANQRRVLNARERDRVLATRPHHCEACGAGPPLDLDHIVPVYDFVRQGHGMEAANDDSNMWLLCKACHGAKTRAQRSPPRFVPGKPASAYGWTCDDVEQELRRRWRKYDEHRFRLLNVLVRQIQRLPDARSALTAHLERLLDTPGNDPALTPVSAIGRPGQPSLRERLQWQ